MGAKTPPNSCYWEQKTYKPRKSGPMDQKAENKTQKLDHKKFSFLF